MAESTIGWFVVKEKYCSLAKKIRFISQTYSTTYSCYSLRPNNSTWTVSFSSHGDVLSNQTRSMRALIAGAGRVNPLIKSTVTVMPAPPKRWPPWPLALTGNVTWTPRSPPLQVSSSLVSTPGLLCFPRWSDADDLTKRACLLLRLWGGARASDDIYHLVACICIYRPAMPAIVIYKSLLPINKHLF